MNLRGILRELFPPLLITVSVNVFGFSGSRTVILEFVASLLMWELLKGTLENYRFFSIHRNYWYALYTLLFLGGMIGQIVVEEFGRAFSPVYFFVAVTALVLGKKPAKVLGVLISTALAIHFGEDMWFFVEGMTVTLVTAFTLRKVYRRSDVVRSSLFVAGAVILVYIAELYSRRYSVALLQPYIAALNPIISTVAVLGILPYIEYASRIYSNIGLMELGNLNHPLLKLLSVRAPGTYQHSAVVANLAEAAAERIGANSLLARVASYYHDIGKIKRPYFFVENQSDENPHDSINPTLSHLILLEHVKYGARIARKYRLPIPIECVIMEHHGTRVQTYFYHKAKENNPNVSEDDFRYPGPKPRFKESGIIMLADSVEAVSRTMRGKSHSQIKSRIEETVMGIFTQRQLDDSGLTLEELELITEEFVKVVSSFLHHRIEYPKEEKVVVSAFDDGSEQD